MPNEAPARPPICCQEHGAAIISAAQDARASLAHLEDLLLAFGGEPWEQEAASLDGAQEIIGILVDDLRAHPPERLYHLERARPRPPRRPGMAESGAQRGNQNGRKHGYTSRQRPVPLERFRADIQRAARLQRLPLAPSELARGLEFHGFGAEAARVLRHAKKLDGIQKRRAIRATTPTVDPLPRVGRRRPRHLSGRNERRPAVPLNAEHPHGAQAESSPWGRPGVDPMSVPPPVVVGLDVGRESAAVEIGAQARSPSARPSPASKPRPGSSRSWRVQGQPSSPWS